MTLLLTVCCVSSNVAHDIVPACRELQGMEYTLDSCQEPHLFVVCKQRREAADTAIAVMFYYILDGSIYQTPTIHGVLSARLVRQCLTQG